MTLLLQVSQALLTPLIAVVVAYIAWKQWRANELKLRLERYERRLGIYREVVKFLGLILGDGKVSNEELSKFR